MASQRPVKMHFAELHVCERQQEQSREVIHDCGRKRKFLVEVPEELPGRALFGKEHIKVQQQVGAGKQGISPQIAFGININENHDEHDPLEFLPGG